MDSRLRRSPPDRASAVPYGQAGENALRFPHLAHRSAAAHKLHSATATTRYEFDSGKSETISRLPALAYSPRKLTKPPGPSQFPKCRSNQKAGIGRGSTIVGCKTQDLFLLLTQRGSESVLCTVAMDALEKAVQSSDLSEPALTRIFDAHRQMIELRAAQKLNAGLVDSNGCVLLGADDI